MKLLSMRVKSFRAIVDQSVEFGDGITIVAGRNEAGKSSLVDAFDHLIKYKAGSGARAVKQTQPVGRDAGPEVEAEFIIGEHHVSYRKRWVNEKETVLSFLAGPRAGEHLTGDAAHNAAEELWSSLDGDLWEASRLMQATALDQTALSSCSALQRALDEQAGGIEGDGSSAPLMSRVSAEVDLYFTPTRGEGKVLKASSRRVEDARERSAAGQAALDDVTGLIDKLVALESQLADKRSLLDEQETELNELADRAEAARREQVALDQAQQDVDVAQRRFDDAEQSRRTRAALAASAEEAQQTLDALLADEAESRARLEPLEEAVAASRERIMATKLELAALKKEIESARRFLRQRQVRDDIESLEAQLAECDQLTDEIAAIDSSIVRIEQETVDRAVELEQQITIAEAAARAGAAQVRLEALSESTALIIDGEEKSIGPEVFDLAVLSELVIDVPGQLRFTVTPDAGAGISSRDLERQKEELASLLDETGCQTTTELRDSLRRCEEATRQVERLRERRADRLGGRDEGALREELSRLKADQQDDDGVEGDIDALTERQEALETELATAETVLDDQQKEADQLRRTLAEATGQVKNQEAVRDRAAGDLAAAREAQPDGELDQACDTAREALAAAEKQVEDAEEKLAESGGAALISDYDLQLQHVEGLRRMAAQSNHDLSVAQGVLESKNRDRIQHNADLARAELDRAEAEHASLLRRAHAAKLLEDVLKKHQQETHRRYVEPFRAELRRLGRATYQDEGFDVTISEDLTVTGRTLGGVRIAFDDLSTGAKEQMSILIRLATASLVSRDDAVPVLFDDTLGYSDRTRLRRVVDAISSGAGQIIIFTANEDRFASLADAERIRI